MLTYNDLLTVFAPEDTGAFAVLTYTDAFEVLPYSDFLHASINHADGRQLLDKLLDIRVFNADKEYRLYRDYCGASWEVSVLSDAEMQNTDFYDEVQYLDIDTKRTAEGASRHPGMLRATGGGWYRFPQGYTKAKIRSYVSYDDNGQAYRIAWRLVGFMGGK